MNMWDDAKLDILRELVGYEPYAIILYGSRVAGYAGPDSDYDIIYIIDGYKPKIKYIYRDIGGTYLSILSVDREFFEEDIYTGVHGEFVAGRLYTVFQPIYNSEYIRRMEGIIKKRAILEELRLLKIKYGGFLKYMKIPIKYFLLARLNKRIRAYPPVKYSYYKTFYGPRGSENFKASLEKFMEAARELSAEGLFKFDRGYVADIDVDAIPASLVEIFKYLYRGMSMYITHGRSASVGLDVVIDEVRSKIRRGVKSFRIPRELEDPEILLTMEGIYFSPGHVELEELIKSIFGGGAEIRKVTRKGIFSDLYVVEVDTGKGVKKIVVKNYPLLSSLVKWLWLYIWLIGVKRFSINPWSRMYREFEGLTILSSHGYKVPRIYALVWGDRVLVEEYIEGIRLDRVGAEGLNYFYEAGKIIGSIHERLGYTIGDTKPQNFIVTDDGLYLIDLEQFNTDDNYRWDISENILYTFIFFRNFRGRFKIIRNILQGYLDGCRRCKDMLRTVPQPRVILAFLPLTPPNIYLNVRKCIREILGAT